MDRRGRDIDPCLRTCQQTWPSATSGGPQPLPALPLGLKCGWLSVSSHVPVPKPSYRTVSLVVTSHGVEVIRCRIGRRCVLRPMLEGWGVRLGSGWRPGRVAVRPSRGRGVWATPDARVQPQDGAAGL